jgi:DCN1-like protein 4/5
MVERPNDFREFYDFAFRYCLTEPGQRIIDTDTAAEMLRLVYPQGQFVDAFCTFLKNQKEYSKINADQWSNFLRFSTEVSADLSNAKENPAWPVLIDNFIEWCESTNEVA